MSGPDASRRFGGLVRGGKALASLFVSVAYLYALEPNLQVTQYAHTSWSQADGQLPGAVHALTQTPDGSLWVGTEFGLYRFDGLKFSPWKPPAGEQLPKQSITALAPAHDGGLWIGTRSGLSFWKGTVLRYYRTSNGADGPSVSSITVDRAGNVSVGTVGFNSGGICRVQADHLKCWSPADGSAIPGVLALTEDKSGTIWVGSVDGLYRWNSAGFHRYGRGAIQAVTPGQDGGVVFSLAGALTQLADGGFADHVKQDALRNTYIRELLSDRDGALWIGTTGQGLFHYYDGRVDHFTRADGLSGDTVLDLFEDREGNVWAATDRGLDRFRQFPVTILSKREGLMEDSVGSVCASSRGGVWIGTRSGLNRVVDGRIASYGPEAGLPAKPIGSLLEDRTGTLWVDSTNGLAFSRGGRFHRLDLPDGRAIRSVAAAAQDRTGAVWFSDFDHGLIRVEAGLVTGVVPWSRFGNRRAWALAGDPTGGGVLLGFAEGGIAAYDGSRMRAEYTSAVGLGRGGIADLIFDRDGTAWIATEGGLSQMQNGRIATLTAENGLPCEQIHALVEDDDGDLWLNTPCGLVWISRRDLEAWFRDRKATIHPTVLGPRDGMRLRPYKSGYFRGAVRSKDGRLWFPVFDGVAVVNPRALPSNRLPPPVLIESILADQVAYPTRTGVELPPIARELQIDYTAFSFVDPEAVRFRYKLEGYDADWVEAAGRRQAFYSGLPPGEYRFRVTASNNDGVWNQEGESLEFTVAPTFYQTTWFRAASMGAFAALLWMGYRVRVRRIEERLSLRFQERLKERTRIARELHDTLLQNIAGVALRLDGLSKTVQTPESVKDDLRGLRRDAESWLREARESVWELHAQTPEDGDLAAAIQRIGVQLTDGQPVRFRVSVSGVRRGASERTQRDLLMIVQEAIRNTVSHARATKIDVNLSYRADGAVSLRICDNGRGFDLNAVTRKPGHVGVAAMQERARNIGADLQITTSVGRGVTIDVLCPAAPTPDRLNHERKAHSNSNR